MKHIYIQLMCITFNFIHMFYSLFIYPFTCFKTSKVHMCNLFNSTCSPGSSINWTVQYVARQLLPIRLDSHQQHHRIKERKQSKGPRIDERRGNEKSCCSLSVSLLFFCVSLPVNISSLPGLSVFLNTRLSCRCCGNNASLFIPLPHYSAKVELRTGSTVTSTDHMFQTESLPFFFIDSVFIFFHLPNTDANKGTQRERDVRGI